jgi:drug/metabolite transporter (DMT)-like permease
MVVVWPFLGALALGTGTFVERIVLMKKRISVKFYQAAQFFSIILVMLPFAYFFWNVSPEFYSLKNIGIFMLIILFSMFANFFTFFSMKGEGLEKLESAKVTEPLFTIILAFVFSFIFGTEMFGRNPKILLPALISAGALIFSHVNKHRLKFSKYYLFAVAGSFFFASELIASKLILDYFNPITFYFLRCISILFFSLILFRPKLDSKLDSKIIWEIFITGIIWFIYRVVIYFGYMQLGVVETTLMIMLGPMFVYFFAWKFLKEKLTWKNLFATGVILLSILYVTFA